MAMTMSPGLRKFALTAHVASSVGWLGAVAGFLALALSALISQDALTVRAAYLAAALLTWYVIIPLSVIALFTGLVQALGTPWGLFQHYWVLFKFLLTVLAVIFLLLHAQLIDYLASVAAQTSLVHMEYMEMEGHTDLYQLRIQIVADAGAAMPLLLVNTALSVYKPRGVTPWGKRQLTRIKN